MLKDINGDEILPGDEFYWATQNGSASEIRVYELMSYLGGKTASCKMVRSSRNLSWDVKPGTVVNLQTHHFQYRSIKVP